MLRHLGHPEAAANARGGRPRRHRRGHGRRPTTSAGRPARASFADAVIDRLARSGSPDDESGRPASEPPARRASRPGPRRGLRPHRAGSTPGGSRRSGVGLLAHGPASCTRSSARSSGRRSSGRRTRSTATCRRSSRRSSRDSACRSGSRRRILTLWIPLGFRVTCYYFRRGLLPRLPRRSAGVRGRGAAVHRRYRMEAALPFILQNLHRFFLYLAVSCSSSSGSRSRSSFVGPDGPRIGLGSVILLVDVMLLTGYSSSCHSLRHLVGGRLDCFSCTRRNQMRHSIWQRLSGLNARHMVWAWASLISIVLADLYIHALALGRDRRPGDPVLGRTLTDGGPRTAPRRGRTTSSSSAPAAPGCAPRSRRRPPAPTSASSASRCSARPTRSWPRAASRRRSATSRPTTRGRSTSATRWSAASYLNNPRMAELHATEAPDRVRELEAWGAVFDRTRDGRILQRPFGGHTHPRLAHVGDRTGLEMIRTLQDRAVALGHRGLHGVHDHPAHHGPSGVTGAVGYWRTTGRPVVFPAKADRPRDRRHRQGVRDHLELVGVQRRRPGARLRGRRRAHRHGVRPVPPDRAWSGRPASAACW